MDDKQFFSFKKVAADMGLIHEVPLVSLHSISKGERPLLCHSYHRITSTCVSMGKGEAADGWCGWHSIPTGERRKGPGRRARAVQHQGQRCVAR